MPLLLELGGSLLQVMSEIGLVEAGLEVVIKDGMGLLDGYRLGQSRSGLRMFLCGTLVF